MPEYWRFDTQFTRRTANVVRTVENMPDPKYARRKNPMQSQPPVLWLCRHDSDIPAGSQATVQILQGSVGNESNLGETLIVKNAFDVAIPANTKFWAAAGRVFDNSSNDKWYVVGLAAGGGTGATQPIIRATGRKNFGNGVSWNVEQQKGAWVNEASGIGVPAGQFGTYISSWHAWVSDVDIGALQIAPRVDRIVGLSVTGGIQSSEQGTVDYQETSVLYAQEVQPIQRTPDDLFLFGYSKPVMAASQAVEITTDTDRLLPVWVGNSVELTFEWTIHRVSN